ncbi:MAG: hypothetical protein ACLFP4_03460 [Spirochaetales bacterium]
MNAEVYGLGIGGRVAVGFKPTRVAWFSLEPEFLLFHYQPNIAGFDTAWILLPGLALRVETPLSLTDALSLTVGASASYRHYLWQSTFDDAVVGAYRPVLAIGGSALVSITDSLSVGPAASYNIFFDDLIRGTVQLELRARYRITDSP